MTKPFLVLGSMKSGTTSVDRILHSHPDVELVAEKETSSFFDRSLSERATKRVFASKAIAAGEVSTKYMQRPLYEPPVDSVEGHLGSNPLLIAILRDPLERAVSHWLHWQHLGWETRSLTEAILSESDNPYLAFSSYFWQLEPWLDRFGRSNIFCIKLEDYARYPSDTLHGLWRFLEVPDPSTENKVVVNANSASDRVVARGRFERLAGSGPYRRWVRPLLPPAGRRALAFGVGGATGRVERPAVDDELRSRFDARLSQDCDALKDRWDHLAW